MKLKIISDGTPQGTRVVDAATGDTVEGICAVDWSVRSDGGPAIAEIYCFAAIEAMGEALAVPDDQVGVVLSSPHGYHLAEINKAE